MKKQNNYNPDVLSCLANLSSDEVFTPPKLANEILNLLPKEIWRDKNATFLDPVCKSGVFLREIAKRLLDGLEGQIPDVQERIDHIYKNQLFGIGITELTSLLSRRSLYCSKKANGKYSVSEAFKNEQGNIFFERTEHNWKSEKCTYCGANRSEYDREEGLETHAYQFIHNNNPNIIKNMKFDVIIGNPPYQLNDGGGTGASAVPLYHKFVEQAKKLNPRFLTMIIPSRWFVGGKGLDDFRKNMLRDNRIRVLVDHPASSDCFPGVSIKGGVCYFLWNRDDKGLCRVVTKNRDKESVQERNLLEKNATTFIRYNEAIPIIKKIQIIKNNFSDLVSYRNPFGIAADFSKYKECAFTRSVLVYLNKKKGYIADSLIKKNREYINSHKVFISKAYGAGEDFPHQIINKPFYGQPQSCSTETYLMIGPFLSKKEALNVISYIKTKFFRFLVLLNKPTQNTVKDSYRLVPIQDFNKSWTDEKLYKKYKLTKKEIDFIESMIRPMQLL